MGRRTRLLDCKSPIEWGHPLNRGLVAEWAVTPLSGWRGGLTLRDLVRGGRNPHDGTLTSMTWQGAEGRPGGYGSLLGNGSSGYVSVPGLAGNHIGTSGFGVAAWVNLSSKGSNNCIISKSDINTVGREWIIYYASSNDRFNFFVQGSGGAKQVTANNFGSPSTGTWYFVAGWVDVGLNNLYVSVNAGTADTTAFADTAVSLTCNVEIGRYDESNFLNGSVDAPMIYNRPLPVAALYAESKRGNPDRWRWVPTRAWFVPAGGNTAYTSSLTGTLTNTGAITKATAETKTGTLTSGGVLTKAVAAAKAGTLTASGSLKRACSHAMTGAVSGAGALTRAASKTLTGTLTAAGVLTRAAAKSLAGSLTLAGSFLKGIAYAKSLGGAITASATLQRAVAKPLAGTITAGASLLRAIAKRLTGLITGSGSYSGHSSTAAVPTFYLSGQLSDCIQPSGLLVNVTSPAGTLADCGTVSGSLA